MFKLIWVPLFHDSTIIGRALSVLFRLSRIFLGLFAFIFVSISIAFIATIWFTLPFLIFFRELTLLSLILIFCGVGFFIIHVFTHPHKKVWQIKTDLDKNLWLASTVSLEKLDYQKLLQEYEVQILIQYLEALPENFQNLKISNTPEVAKEAYNLARVGLAPYITPVHFFDD